MTIERIYTLMDIVKSNGCTHMSKKVTKPALLL